LEVEGYGVHAADDVGSIDFLVSGAEPKEKD